MKTLLVCLLTLTASAFGQSSPIVQVRPHSGIQRVEALTDSEKVQLEAAWKKVSEAIAAKDKTEAEIAAAHKMTRESYMEWSSTWTIDGDWIFYYFNSHQNTNIGW